MVTLNLAFFVVFMPLRCAAGDPPDCPIACPYDHHHKSCGKDGVCPPSIVYSAGFDSDMVLQRSGGAGGDGGTSAAAVYGLVVSPAAEITVTVTDEDGAEPSYTVIATVHQTTLQTSKAGGNYTATFKAMLKPHKAGGAFTITATCHSGCFDNATRDRALIERVTWGDVYFCSGQRYESTLFTSLQCTFSCFLLAELS